MNAQINSIINSNPSLFGLMFKDYQNGKIIFTEPSPLAIKTAERNLELFNERQQAIYNRTKISEGDYVILLNGSRSRVTVTQWENSVQIGGLFGGSYYLHKNGFCSYSGSCGDSVLKSELVDTGLYENGLCWIFCDDSSGAGRGLYNTLKFKVWQQV